MIHVYNASTPNTCNRTVNNQVKSNTWNNLIYGHHRYSKKIIMLEESLSHDHKCLYRKIDYWHNKKKASNEIIASIK